jgi:ADP-heptose:LPS heptosyltransferase
MLDARWRAARRVLAVRLDNLGDVLLTSPALRAISASLPGAEVTLLTSPVGAQVGRLHPDLAGVIVAEVPWVDPWQQLPHDSARERQLIETLRAGRFDAAIIFTSFRQSPLPAAYLCYLADIPLRLGATTDGAGSVLTTRHRPPERLCHEVERGLDLVAAIGLTTTDDRLALAPPPSAHAAARDWLASMEGRQGPLIVIHPGCSMPARTYPWDGYAAIAVRLVAELGATIVLTGDAGERELLERIVGHLDPATRRSTSVCAGSLPFPVFCALIAAADLTVTNNTGPMHIAAAMGTPVVALFALTNPPEQWKPWRVPHRLLYHDVPCRICYSRACPYGHECLRLVTPAMVVTTANELLAEQSAARDASSPALLAYRAVP